MNQLLEFYHNVNGIFVNSAIFWCLWLVINARTMDKNIEREMTKLEMQVCELHKKVAKLESP